MTFMTTADLDQARLRGTTSRRSSPRDRMIAVQRSNGVRSQYNLEYVDFLNTRVNFLPIKGWLNGIRYSIPDILGYESVDFAIAPLYLPGTIPFMLVAIMTIFIHGMRIDQVKSTWIDSFKQLKNPAIAMFFAVALVEIFKQSTHNTMGFPSMPLAMAQTASALAGKAWPMVASFVGALGSFITGSNTVSDLLFAEFQYATATQLDISRLITIALQVVGGAMGNMVCIHNIVAASATVGLVGLEGMIIQRNALPLIIYGLVVGIMGMLFSYLLFPGIF